MIFDNIRNCELYYSVNKGFEKAFDFIKKAVIIKVREISQMKELF